MIAVRSYLAAGSAAVVAAGAIVLTPNLAGPTLNPTVLPVAAAAEITLTGLTMPFTDILGVLQTLGGLGGSLGDVLVGLLPQEFVNDVIAQVLDLAVPLIGTAAAEVLGYVGGTLAALPGEILSRVVAAATDFPAVLAGAVEALGTGDIGAALQAVTTGLAAPFVAVGQAIAEAAQVLQEFVVGELNTIVAALPGILLTSIQTVVGDTVQATLDSITEALSGLFGGLFPAAAGSAAAPVPVLPAASLAPASTAPEVPVAETVPAEQVSAVAPPAEPRDSVSRVARPRAVAALPSAAESLTESAAESADESTGTASVEQTRPNPTLRAARQGAERPSGAAPSRAVRAAE